MVEINRSTRKTARKAIVRRVVAATHAVKQAAQAALMRDRTLPPPVELEPQGLDSPALRRLKEERRRLLEEIKHQEIPTSDHPTTGTHMADDASEVAEQVTMLALRRHLEGLLQEVERAMVRVEQGTYGLCERCHQPISEERLQVMPSATLCIACAQLQNRPLKVAA